MSDELSSLSICILAAILSLVPRTAPLSKVNLMIGNDDALENLETLGCERPLEDLDGVLCNLPKLKKVTLRSVLNDTWEVEDEADAALFQWIIDRLPGIKGKKGVRVGYVGGDL